MTVSWCDRLAVTVVSTPAIQSCLASRDGQRDERPARPGRLARGSVDRLILAASLVLPHEARNDRNAPRRTRFMLWLGIGATIGANIAYGAGYGLLGALISAWPAVAFIGPGCQ